MVKGGEPITVNAAIATGLLTAVEELYRNSYKNKKSKKGGEPEYEMYKQGGMLGSPVDASHLLLDRTSVSTIGGNNKNRKNKKGGELDYENIIRTAFASFPHAAQEIINNKNNNPSMTYTDAVNDLQGSWTTPPQGLGPWMNAFKTYYQMTGERGGSNKNRKNKKGGGHNVGELHPADVTAPLTLIMNPDGSMPGIQSGGKKNKKVRGGSEPAPTDASYTILMPEKQGGALKLESLKGGNKKNNNKDNKNNKDNNNKKLVGGLAQLTDLLANLSKLT